MFSPKNKTNIPGRLGCFAAKKYAYGIFDRFNNRLTASTISMPSSITIQWIFFTCIIVCAILVISANLSGRLWVGVIIIMIIIIVDGYCYYCTGFVWIIRKRIKLRQNKMEWNKIKIYRSIGKWKGSKRSLSLNLVGNPNLSYPILNHPSMALHTFRGCVLLSWWTWAGCSTFSFPFLVCCLLHTPSSKNLGRLVVVVGVVVVVVVVVGGNSTK